MDLADIREQVLSSNISVQEKAQILLHEKVAYDMSKKEWLELLIGVPADVRGQIGQLKLAGKQVALFMSV